MLVHASDLQSGRSYTYFDPVGRLIYEATVRPRGTKPFSGRQEPMRRTPSQEYACQINVLQRPCLNLDRKKLAAAVGLVVMSGAICGICERRARRRSQAL